jgi:excisionase family DNA binding protein
MESVTVKPASEAIEKSRFLNAAEVMELLHVSRSTLYNLIFRKENPLPTVKIGKARRFPFDLVRAWMESLGK